MTFLKWYLLLASLLVVIPQEAHPQNNSRITEGIPLNRNLNILDVFQSILSGNFNKVVDVIFDNLGGIIKKFGMDPIVMPGYEKSLTNNTYIKLSNGTLEGISTMLRRGNVSVKVGYPNASLRAGIGLSKLRFCYKHEIKLIGFGPEGTVDGECIGNELTVDFETNLNNLKVKMHKFVFKIGKVSIEIRGGLIAKIINLITKIIMPQITGIIEAILQALIKRSLEEAINAYNTIICRISRLC